MTATHYFYSLITQQADADFSYYLRLGEFLNYDRIFPDEFNALPPKGTLLTSSQNLVRKIGKALIQGDKQKLVRLGVQEEFFKWLKE